MRGKIVNLCIAFMNILFGSLIIIYSINVPQDKTLMTVQENYVVNYILIVIYIIMGITVLIDAIQSYNHKSDTTFNIGYMIGVFSISFIFIKEPAIGAFSIISGLMVFVKSIKENLVELNSTTGISISIVMMVAIAITGILSFNYDEIGEYIKNKENEDELAYVDDYFKYVTELDIQEPYINVKKDGKFGYINPNGDVVINFKFDYASPFVKITSYDKNFYVALVCENGSSYIILKNERKVLSYRTESADIDYKAKLEELQNIYKNTLKQTEDMTFEIQKIDNHINKIPVYQDSYSQEYDFRYDYNDEYDILVTQSNLGLGDTYELAKKDALDIKINLDTDYLDYDSSYLYIFSNGSIPFYEISKRTQGWFTSYGKKNVMTGKAQILDFYGDKILLRNYNNNTVYFIDGSGNRVSEEYKDIFVCNDGRYIVRCEDNSFKIIDENYNSVFEKQYATINPRLIGQGLYLVLDSVENIKFNDYNLAEFNWSILNYDGNVILDGIEQIYDEVYEFPNEEKDEEDNYIIFEDKLRDLDYKFVGDKFYLDYQK